MERAFLVGVVYRLRGAKGKTPKSQLTAGAAAARDSAALRTPAATKPRIPEFSAEESLAELRALTESAGADVVGEFLQHRGSPDPATLIGRGKLEEIAGAVVSAQADVVLFDHDLTPSQQRNIENELHARVIDRTQLILDIFARHARTKEGQLQVELAQLNYMLPRLKGRGIEMSQLGGGIGTRGPGETQLETDKRKIARRVRHVKQQIEEVRRIRAQQRQRRESVPVPTVALVGYTNAGKSTLFNALTEAGVLESPRMFATLDPTLRSITLPSKRKVLLSDTVGFIRSLPHTLVSAFRATLEEVQRASLVLHVSDASSLTFAEQDSQVEVVLRELEVDKKPRLHVHNKLDLVPAAERAHLANDANAVYVSSTKQTGLPELLARIDAMLDAMPDQDAIQRVTVRIPQSEGKILALLEAKSRIHGRNYIDGAVELEIHAPASVVRRVAAWVVRKEGRTKARKKQTSSAPRKPAKASS